MATKHRSRIRRRSTGSTTTPPPVGQTDPVFDTTVPVPAQVTGLSVGTVTSTTAALTWAAVAGADAYRVDLHRKDGTYWGTRKARPTGTSYTITSLSPSQAYEFRVSARNAGGFGPTSTIATATTSAATGSESPRGEGLNDEPRPTPALRSGGPIAGTFDVLAYPWTGIGRTSTNALTGPPTESTDILVAAGATMSDRSSGWEGYLKLGKNAHLTQSHVVSRVTTDYGTSAFTPVDQARVSWCSSEPGPVTQKYNGPLHVDHCYITTADDGWRPIVNAGGGRGTMQYTWIHRPYGRSLLPDGTPSEAHHDGIQGFGMINGLDVWRCVIEGFSVGILNTTAETAPVSGLLVEECWLENDVGLSVIHYGSKMSFCAPSQAYKSASFGPGDPTWMTYKNCLFGPIASGSKIIQNTYVLGSEAERDAMVAAGASAKLARRSTDPKTGKEYKLANGQYATELDRAQAAAAIVVFEGSKWAGREFVTGAADPNPTHTPGSAVQWGEQMVTWPPKPLADGTQWWTYDKPRYLRERATKVAATFTAAGTKDLTITWVDPPQTTDYEVRIAMSSWSNGVVWPELVSQSATGIVVRVNATGPTASLTTAQHTVAVHYREARTGDIPARPNTAITKMAS